MSGAIQFLRLDASCPGAGAQLCPAIQECTRSDFQTGKLTSRTCCMKHRQDFRHEFFADKEDVLGGGEREREREREDGQTACIFF